MRAVRIAMFWLIWPMGLVSSGPVVPLIVGGRSVNITQFPYQVELYYRGLTLCSGSILSNTKTLTAAHCVYTLNDRLMSVGVGNSFRGHYGAAIAVRVADSHPDFEPDSQNYDAAVVTLTKGVTFGTRVKPVQLPHAGFNTQPGDRATVSGWGFLQAQTDTQPMQLQAVEVVEVERGECQAKFKPVHRVVTESMLCYAYPGGGKDACSGDSGAPLVTRGIQIGIVSWGIGCADPKFPGVYTRIASLRDYIDQQLAVTSR